MSRIAVLLTDMFQDVEYEKPADAFRKAGHVLTHVGLRKGARVKGEHGMMVTIDRAVHDVRVDDFDALFIPGGYFRINSVSMTMPFGLRRSLSRAGSPSLGSAMLHNSSSPPRC